MMKSDKQASLSSVLLAARKAAASPEEDASAAGAGPSLRVVRSLPEDLDDAAAAVPTDAPELRQDLMFSKGAASAAGFRPAYWTYERNANGEATPPDDGDAAAAARAGADHRTPLPPDPRLLAKRRMQWAVIGFGAVALVVSTTSLLNIGSRSTAVESAPPLVAVAPRVAAPVAMVAPPQKSAAVPAQPAPVQSAPAQTAPEPKPAVATAVASAPPGAAAAVRAEADDMLVRGVAALEMGDVASARLYFERAAAAPDARAALLLGQTFDPAFLKRIGVLGVRGDPAQAALWYRKARALGEPTAESHLDSLGMK